VQALRPSNLWFICDGIPALAVRLFGHSEAVKDVIQIRVLISYNYSIYITLTAPLPPHVDPHFVLFTFSDSLFSCVSLYMSPLPPPLSRTFFRIPFRSPPHPTFSFSPDVPIILCATVGSLVNICLCRITAQSLFATLPAHSLLLISHLAHRSRMLSISPWLLLVLNQLHFL